MTTIRITPKDARYEAMSQGFNQRFLARPDHIALVETADDVVEAVRSAGSAKQRISVRSGGHCYENFVCNPEIKVIIDVSRLDQVRHDEETAAYEVGAGATNWHLATHLYRPYGLAVPGGSCYSVGAGGHVSGGGFGLLSRQHGLTVDLLYAVEVVVVDERGGVDRVIARADAQDLAERDLFWAHTGGGGGNFGVITRYWFRDLPEPPKNVWLSGVQFDWDAFAEDEEAFRTLLRNYGGFFERHKHPGDEFADLFAVLKLTHQSNGSLGLLVQSDATRPGSEERLTEFYTAVLTGIDLEPLDFTLRAGEHAPAEPLTMTGRVLPWIQATQTLNGSGENQRGKYKSAYHRTAFTEHHIAAMYRHLTDMSHPNPAALIQVDSYGARINAVPSDATAVPQRDSAMKLQYQTYWTDPADDEANLAWIRECYRDVYAEGDGVPVPDEHVDGAYVNYPDVDLSDPEWNPSGTPWSTLYYKDGYPELRRIKSRWDPNNVFRHAQSIEPY